MSSPDKNDEQALRKARSLDAWTIYCEVFHEMFGENATLELSPAVLMEFVDRVKAQILSVPSARKSTERVIEAARKAVKHNNFIVGMKDTDPGKGPMNYLADALAEFDASTDGSIAK